MSAELKLREFASEEVALIKQTICKGATDVELALFLNQCKRTGLDPLSRQIHAVKRWDATAGREVMSMQTGIDGFRLIAERTGKYAGNDDPQYDREDAPHPNKATVTVWKLVEGQRVPFTRSARWAEFVQTKKGGEVTRFWAKMPYLMLGKVAEALALRAAFPQELSGLYTSDEMGQADHGDELEAAHRTPDESRNGHHTVSELRQLPGVKSGADLRKPLPGEREILAAKTLDELTAAWKLTKWSNEAEKQQLVDIAAKRKAELQTEGKQGSDPTKADSASAASANDSPASALPKAPRSGPTAQSVSDLILAVAEATQQRDLYLITQVCDMAGAGALDDMTPQQLRDADAWLRGQVKGVAA